jgi:hypothetical protein
MARLAVTRSVTRTRAERHSVSADTFANAFVAAPELTTDSSESP